MAFEQSQFQEFVRAGHSLFNLFEARWDFYPAARACVSGWLEKETFELAPETADRLRTLTPGVYEIFGIAAGPERDRFTRSLGQLADALQARREANVGLGIAPYLFTWNLRRFVEYLRRNKRFDSVGYFERLGEYLLELRESLYEASSLSLLEVRNPLLEDELWEAIHRHLSDLGIGQREPVGTIKVLHVFAPGYFPLLDHSIAEAFRLVAGQKPVTKALYLDNWLPRVRAWLRGFNEAAQGLEANLGEPVLKLLDEALYVACSIDLSLRIREVGL